MSRGFLNSIQFRLYAALGLLAVMLLFVVYLNANITSESSRSLDTLNSTGLFRARTNLLASLARRAAAAGSETDRLALLSAMQETIEQFDLVRVGLRAGDASLNLEPITNPDLLALMDSFDAEWENYKAQLVAFIEANAAGPTSRLAASMLTGIENQSIVVFTYANRLVSGIKLVLEQDANTVRQLSLGAGALALVVSVFAVYVIAQSVRSIQGLATTARAFADGDLTARANVRTLNEAAQTAIVFNEMGDQINELVDDLEQRVRDALEAQERAERSDRVKSAFLASMSHELRTPLNAVINFTRFVLDGDTGPVNDQQKELLADVVSSAHHLLNLINDVLDMSKIEAGSLNLFIEDNLNMNAIVNSAVTTAQGLLADKPVRLVTEIEPNLPPVRGDKQRLLQILLNILSNACKFTEEGEIKVVAYPANGQIVVAVSDSGPGIARDDQALVFEAFKQTTSGLRQGGGTGLGMPIARSLSEAHGGHLWLTSEVGEGATFYVAIPTSAAAPVPALAGAARTA